MTYYKDMYKNSNYVKLQKLYAQRKQLEIALGQNDELVRRGGGRARYTKKLNASYYGTTACPQDYMHEILSNVVDVNRDTDHNKIVNWKYEKENGYWAGSLYPFLDAKAFNSSGGLVLQLSVVNRKEFLKWTNQHRSGIELTLEQILSYNEAGKLTQISRYSRGTLDHVDSFYYNEQGLECHRSVGSVPYECSTWYYDSGIIKQETRIYYCDDECSIEEASHTYFIPDGGKAKKVSRDEFTAYGDKMKELALTKEFNNRPEITRHSLIDLDD